MKRRAPVSREYIESLLDKEDGLNYGYSIKGGLSPEEQHLRNKALISLLYLSARRISELVGRTYTDEESGIKDVWEGVKVSDFKYDILGGVRVLIMNCRILKKGGKKRGLRKEYADVILDCSDHPFIDHIEEWIEHQKKTEEDKLFSISRSRAYQIMKEIDPAIVGPHWFRHQRLSHLGEVLNPYQLTEQIGFWESIDPAVAYVHGRVSTYLDATKKSRREL